MLSVSVDKKSLTLSNAYCRSAIKRNLEPTMATAAARKAWNDAMKATAATALVPTAGRNSKRRSDRHKKQDRRTKARRVFHNAENDEFRTALWVDALEGVDPAVAAGEDDDDYDFGGERSMVVDPSAAAKMGSRLSISPSRQGPVKARLRLLFGVRTKTLS